jgi:hypothetical protein
MCDAVFHIRPGLRFVEAGEKHDEKRHVEGQSDLPADTVTFLKPFAETAVIGMVEIIILELHLCFINCDISKHLKPLKSALLDKRRITFGTADLDTPLAPGDADLLPAGRTFVDMMRLSLCHQVLLPVISGAETAGMSKIPLILGSPPVDVPGKHAEIRIYDTAPG